MNPAEALDAAHVDAMVRAALEEDAARADVTAAFVGLGERVVEAEIEVAASVFVCGIDVARRVFASVDASCAFDALCADGARAEAGACIGRVRGRAASIVAAERTALNFVQRMSGVATLAARFVAAVEGTGVVILDTRKTIPLWRELDKYAVRCGGAHNHRRALDAMVLVKDNHVRALGGTDGLLAALSRHADNAPFVEVEVDSIDLLRAVITRRVDRIMLDNFTPEGVAGALRVLREHDADPGRRIEIEVSGGITLENVRAYAQPGVDFISVGAITHSAPAAPVSLTVK